MGRFERTWPTAVAAMGLGALIGAAVLAPPTLSLLREDAPPELQRLDRGPDLLPPPPARPLPPPPVRAVPPASRGIDGLLIRDRRGNDVVIGTEDLLEMLRTDEQAAARRLAAAALATSPRSGHVSPALMIAAATDADPTVRATAARSLGRLGDAEVVPVLIVSATTDADAVVRGAAVSAIGELPGTFGLQVLDEVVAILDGDGAEHVRVQAAFALGHLGDEAARGPLERARDEDGSEKVRRAATLALARLHRGGDR